MKICPKGSSIWLKALFLLILITNFALGQSIDSTDNSKQKNKNYLRAGYSYDVFDAQLSDWQAYELELGMNYKKWLFLPRFTYAQRFGQDAVNAELEAFKFRKNGDYWNFLGAFSGSDILPVSRAHAEYYNPFLSWEHSIGLSWYNFDQTGNIYIATSSISKYYGPFLTIFRVYGGFSENNNDLSVFNLTLQHRYYFNDEAHLGINASYGFDNSLVIISDLSGIENIESNVLNAGLFFQSKWQNKWKWRLAYNWYRYDFESFDRNQHGVAGYLYYNIN